MSVPGTQWLNASTPKSGDPGPAAPDAGTGATRATAGATFDFWRTVHRALRGRYRLSLLLAIAGGAVGAWAGTTILGKRLYSATGLVRIASALPQVLKETDQNRPMANFDGYIQAQREVMMSPEVVHAALKDEAWHRLGAGHRVPTDAQFASGLKVEARPRSDHLRVSVAHKDPLVAAAGVQTLIGAYQQAFTRQQDAAEGSRMALLKERRAALDAQRSQLESQMSALSSGRSEGELESDYQVLVERLRKLRSALTDVQIGIAGGPVALTTLGGTARDAAESMEDKAYQSYADEKIRLELQLTESQSHGLTARHPTIIRLQAAVRACDEQMKQLANRRDQRVDSGAADPAPKSLRDREASLRALCQAAQGELTQLSSARERLKDLDVRATAIRAQLADTDSRLDSLTTEGSLGGRLSVVSAGERPMTALIDNRAKMAVSGFVAGFGCSVGSMVLLASLRRRYRFGLELAEDLADRVPCVAVLPEVGSSQELDTLAARCIHDLRIRLQPQPGGEPRMYLVTSVGRAEGKSALSLSMALSFAAAGYRTLLIDADLVSRQLSLALGAGEAPGLFEAIGGQEPAIQRLGAGLAVLSAGNCRPQDACKLVPTALRRVLAGLRERFEVVLIDSDSILNGVNSSVIAPQAERSIFVVKQGQDPHHVRRAIDQLEMLGATLSAAAFNRARAADFRAVLEDQPPVSGAQPRAMPEHVSSMGPLVAQVLCSLSLTREEDLKLRPNTVALARADITGNRSNAADTDHRSKPGDWAAA